MKKIIVFSMALAALVFSSCSSDYLKPEDTQHMDAETAEKVSGENPDVFLNGEWSWMIEYDPFGDEDNANHDTFGWMSICLVADMTGQDMTPSADHWFSYDYNFDNRMQTYRRVRSHWLILYSMIDKANAILSIKPNTATAAGASLVGQALAIRGLAYFTLIQLYQNPIGADGKIDRTLPGVPMYFSENALDQEGLLADHDYKSRNTVGMVLDQTELDLKRAISNLTFAEANGWTRTNKNFIDLSVANGIMARYYLYKQDYASARDCADAALQGYTFMSDKELLGGFYSIDNPEWMWGFDHNTETATSYASFFSHISSYGAGYGNGYSTKCIDASLYDKIDDDDIRKEWFTGPDGDGSTAATLPYANKKFGSDGQRTEDYMYMRVAEMYLIKAECSARLGSATQAATDLKPLLDTRYSSGWNQTRIGVEDVLIQRRIELWGEGFGYFDLKRINRGVNRTYDGSNHFTQIDVEAQSPKWVYQIPLKEIQENTSISEADQNE